MKKFCAILLFFALFCGVTSAENFPAWDIADIAAPEIKQSIEASRALGLNNETLPSLCRRMSLFPIKASLLNTLAHLTLKTVTLL